MLNSVLIYQRTGDTEGRLGLTQAVYCEDAEALVRDTDEGTLEAAFEAGNTGRLPRLAYSVSVGDVIALVDDEGKGRHFIVEMTGFNQVRAFERYDAEGRPVLKVVL